MLDQRLLYSAQNENGNDTLVKSPYFHFARSVNVSALLGSIVICTAALVIFLGSQVISLGRQIIGNELDRRDGMISSRFQNTVNNSDTHNSLTAADPQSEAVTVSSPSAPSSALQMEIADISPPTQTEQIEQKSATDSASTAHVATGQPATSQPATNSANKQATRGIVTAELVNVRSAPSIAGELLTQVRQNEMLAITQVSEDGAWFQVCCPTGSHSVREAWVSAEFIQQAPNDVANNGDHIAVGEASFPNVVSLRSGNLLRENGAPRNRVLVSQDASTEINTGAKTGTINGTLVNVRSGPGTQFPIVGQLQLGASITIREESTNSAWLSICCVTNAEQPLPEQSGWISAEFVIIERS